MGPALQELVNHEHDDESPTSIDNESATLVIFPNPTNGEINIQLEPFEGKAVKILVYNHLGRNMWQQEIDEVKTPGLKVDLPKQRFESGFYMVAVLVEGHMYSQHLIIAR